MRKPEQSPEPSIEEILASIRRIIADDGVQGSNAGITPKAAPEKRPQSEYFDNLTVDRDLQRPLNALDVEAPEPAEPRLGDEILELTEDNMLEGNPAGGRRDAGPGPAKEALYPDERAFAEQYQRGREQFDDRGLQNVLSSVAAEVERLETTDRRNPNIAAPIDRDQDDDSEAQRSAASPSPPLPQSTPPSTPPASEREGLDQRDQSSRFRPEPKGPKAPPPPPRTHSRQVWSARRLEDDVPPAAPAHHQHESVETAKQDETQGEPRGGSGRDRWAEGVHMPVPESGPAIPFPYPREHEAKSIDNAPENAELETDYDDDNEAIEKDRNVVGDFLTRVFGHVPQQRGEEAVAEEPAPKGRAEKLAEETIADFVSEKLRAPTVAEALHADKPFMDHITDSLETALAHAEAAEHVERPEQASTGSQSATDEVQEIPPPPDSEFLPYGSSMDESSDTTDAPDLTDHGQPDLAFPEARADFAAPTPELPAESPETTPDEPATQPPRDPSAHAFRPQPNPLLRSLQTRNVPRPQFSEQPAVKARIATKTAPTEFSALPGDLEDSIKEMIKPLIINWLNDNLLRIVEKAVREELAERSPLSELRVKGG